MVDYESIRRDEAIRTYIVAADESLSALGFTEHCFPHMTKVANDVSYILTSLGYDKHTVELGMIAGYLHDIGNLVNRTDHSQSGAVMAFRLLEEKGMPPADIARIVSAIGNHDEGTGVPVSSIAAALIIADKSDVRRTRVRNSDISSFDIHDRVNYSVTSSGLSLSEDERRITLRLTIDTSISSVMSYFEIFLGRMLMCRKAAEKLGLEFSLVINDQVQI